MGKYDAQIAAFEAPAQGFSAPAASAPPKGKYADQIASFEAAPEAQAAPQAAPADEKPGFFSPEEIASRGIQGAVGSIPFTGAAKNLLNGEAPYSATPEGVGQAAGDVGGTAAAIASGGVMPLLKFAGAGALLNAAGIPQGAAKIGDVLEAPGNQVNIPSKVMGIEGLGTLLDALVRTPGAAASTAVQAAPYYLAGKGIGVGEPAAAATEGKAVQVPKTPTPEDLLQQNGGELSLGMRANGRLSKAVTGGVEKLAGTNPITAALPEGIQAKNVAAVQNYLEKELGPQVSGLSALDYAPILKETVGNYKDMRSAKFAAAEQGLSGIESKLPKPVGQMASDRIISLLQQAGVPYDEKGFNPDLMTGNEKIDPKTAQGLVAMERQVRNAQTIPDLLAQRQNIDRGGIPNFEAPPDQMGRLKNMARGIVNGTLTDAVNSAGDPKVAQDWAEANREYQATQPVMKKIAKGQANQLNGPEVITKIVTNPTEGAQALSRLKANMPPEQWEKMQGGVVNAILDKSRLPADENGVGAISSDRLKTNMGKTMSAVFSQLDPEKQAILRNAQKMMETAQLADLRKANPSGSAVLYGKGAHVGAALAGLAAPHLLAPLLGETAGLGAYYGAGKTLPPMLEALGNAKARVGAAMQQPIHGTAPIPPAILNAFRRTVR